MGEYEISAWIGFGIGIRNWLVGNRANRLIDLGEV